MNRRNPSSNRAPGRKSRSVMAFAALAILVGAIIVAKVTAKANTINLN